jgi:hypothetical protein
MGSLQFTRKAEQYGQCLDYLKHAVKICTKDLLAANGKTLKSGQHAERPMPY